MDISIRRALNRLDATRSLRVCRDSLDNLSLNRKEMVMSKHTGRICDYCGKPSNPRKGGITWYHVKYEGKATSIKAHPKCVDYLRKG